MASLRSRLDATLTLSGLLDKLRAAWNAETSATPDEWRANRPSVGQCAVTALIVQDHFGGELQRCIVDGGVSHYFNLFEIDTTDESGRHIVSVSCDLTRDQFDKDAHFSDSENRARDYVLGYPATARRYELLKERLS
jgi:hypothetical protein